MSMPQLTGNIIIDMQFGSTGKGLIAGYLAERDNPDTVVTAWAANAGHTYVDSRGKKYVRTMLANGTVSKGLKRVMIGPGSLIDPESLAREIDHAGMDLSSVEIAIHPGAAIITQKHRDEEAGPMTKIGSTKKGCGAASIQRIRRDPDDQNTASIGGAPHPLLVEHGLGRYVVQTGRWFEIMTKASKMQIEGAQGYSLSMYHGFYPYTTSRDVSVHQLLADCGVPVGMAKKLTVVGTARTYPIRVANRFDDQGNQVGWSGPCYSDQEETSFGAIGQEVELTTVTKLPRRIFTFSNRQIAQAALVNGVQDVFLNFMNYLPREKAVWFLDEVNRVLWQYRAKVRYLGFGPSFSDVYDLEGIPEGELINIPIIGRHWGAL